jgi:hypothetical protein
MGMIFMIFTTTIKQRFKCHSFELLAHLLKTTSEIFNKMTAHGVTDSDFIGIDFVLLHMHRLCIARGLCGLAN